MLKTRLTSRLTAVWLQDPAFDHEADDWEARVGEYRETGEVSALPLKNGEAPAEFSCERLSRKDYIDATLMPPLEAASFVVKRSLKAITGITDDEGRPMPVEFDKGGDLAEVTMGRLWNPDLMTDIATQVLKHSVLNPTNGRR